MNEQTCICHPTITNLHLASQIKAAMIRILFSMYSTCNIGQSSMLIVLGRGQERSFNFSIIVSASQ